MATLMIPGKRLMLAASLMLALCFSAPAATLLPPGKQTFTDSNGAPLAGGTVTFYAPGTSTLKDTYQDPGQSQLNTNPVTLDGAGQAVIYGNGAYREIVRDAAGNLIWDQLTADTSAAFSSWAGIAGGTNNALTLSAPSFSYGDGQTIDFVAGQTNTGSVTITPNGTSPVVVKRDSDVGAITLTGGEIVAGNVYHVTFTAGAFHLSTAFTTPPANGNFPGTLTVGGNSTIGGNATVSGGLAVGQGVAVSQDVHVTGTVYAGATHTGPLYTDGNGAALGPTTVAGGLSTSGNLSVGGNITLSGVTPDPNYSATGSIVLPYGAGVRASNTVSARGSFTVGYFGNNWNLSLSPHTGGSGIWDFTFTEPMQNANFSVVVSAMTASGGATVGSVVSNKTVNGFRLTTYGASGVTDPLGTSVGDIVVFGGN